MSFERQPMSEGSLSPNMAPMAPVMREDRVLNPYALRNAQPAQAPLPAKQPIGQFDSNKGSEAEEEKPAGEETVRLSPQMAALARREQKFRQQMSQFEKERAALAAERSEIEGLRSMKEKLAAKDYSGLDGLVDYNEYSQYQLNKAQGQDPVQDEIKKLTSKIDELEKSTKDHVEKQFDAAVNERRVAAKQLIDSSPEFKSIKKAGPEATEAVVHHILETWENDNVEITVEQAAKEVEEILREKAKAWAALLEEEKIETPPEEEKKSLPPLKPALKTLTNQVTTGELKRPTKPLSMMNDSDRWAEARRRAEEKLQQTRR
jgi:hypothetical protein